MLFYSVVELLFFSFLFLLFASVLELNGWVCIKSQIIRISLCSRSFTKWCAYLFVGMNVFYGKKKLIVRTRYSTFQDELFYLLKEEAIDVEILIKIKVCSSKFISISRIQTPNGAGKKFPNHIKKWHTGLHRKVFLVISLSTSSSFSSTVSGPSCSVNMVDLNMV